MDVTNQRWDDTRFDQELDRIRNLWPTFRELDLDEIAEYLGVSRDTVYAWIAGREMPAHRVGRFWKFKREEVDGWVRDGHAAVAPPAGSDRDHNRD